MTTPTLSRRLKAIETKRAKEAERPMIFRVTISEASDNDIFGEGVRVTITDDDEKDGKNVSA